MAISTWLLCQLAALAASSWLFFRTTRDAPFALRAALVRALPFTVVGALGVDYALHLIGYLVAGARGTWGALPPFGGIMAYGALFGLSGAFVWFSRGSGVSAYRALDRLTAPLALLVAIGRLGCAFAGCEHGRPTGASWGVTYPSDHPQFEAFVRDGAAVRGAAHTLPLHPATLYEASFALAACCLALALLPRKSTRPGGVFFAGTLLYAGGRIVSESFRGDLLRDASSLTTGQAMSVFAIGLALSLVLRESEGGLVRENAGGAPLARGAEAPREPTGELRRGAPLSRAVAARPEITPVA